VNREEKFKSFLGKLKTEENTALIEAAEKGFDALLEANKFVQAAKPKKGKMHELLGIPQDEEVKDHFKSGKALAIKLLAAVDGDKKKASSMLAIPANANPSHDIFDEARTYLKNSDKK
jgi:hypothetical protein